MSVQAARLARKAAQRGYKWLALEIDDYGNAAVWPWFRDNCHANGIKPGTWVTNGENLSRFLPEGVEFIIAEDEGPGDRRGIIESLPFLPPALPKAIIGNGWFNAGSKDEMAPVVAAGFHFLTEMYLRTDDGTPTGYTPDGLHWNANVNLGFPTWAIQPCFGLFGGAQAHDYDQWRAAWPGWSEYTVEGILSNV